MQRGERGLTTIEGVIVLSLLAIVLLGLTGLHTLAISTGTAAETSSIATNLARARLEEILALPPAEIVQQNDTQAQEQVPAGVGPMYTVRTSVGATGTTRLDIAVTVSWQVTYNAACAARARDAVCTGSSATYTRTLRTRLYHPDLS